MFQWFQSIQFGRAGTRQSQSTVGNQGIIEKHDIISADIYIFQGYGGAPNGGVEFAKPGAD